ncbi:MAG: ATP-binding protein [Akkermansiaceae bacterium]
MVPSLLILSAGLAVTLGLLVIRYCREQTHRSEEIRRLEEKHLSERATLQSENHALLNALNDPLFLIDAEQRLQFANILGMSLFPERDILNRPLEEVFLDRRICDPIRQALKEQIPVTTQLTLAQESSPFDNEDHPGETTWLVDARPIDCEQSTSYVRVIIRNTTDEHHTEQVRKDFVANASHELRTPLAIINGYLENLLEEGMLSDQATALRFLRIMRKHGKRIARIVEDMLIISRLESGEAGSLKVKPFRLEACIRDVVERLESVITEQGAEVTLSMSDPDLRMKGDRFYWTQVLFNLVENALKQNPEIALVIEVGSETAEDGLRIWVADNGVGIPAADLPFIFRRFYRVEKHHSQVEIKGTGLGLSIVRRAIDAHGGKVDVTSVPGEETRFEILLPKTAIAKSKPRKNPDEAFEVKSPRA